VHGGHLPFQSTISRLRGMQDGTSMLPPRFFFTLQQSSVPGFGGQAVKARRKDCVKRESLSRSICAAHSAEMRSRSKNPTSRLACCTQINADSNSTAVARRKFADRVHRLPCFRIRQRPGLSWTPREDGGHCEKKKVTNNDVWIFQCLNIQKLILKDRLYVEKRSYRRSQL
jgi:hypothetical protein